MNITLGGAFCLFLVLIQMCLGHPDLHQYRCHSTVDVEEGTEASIQEEGLHSPSYKFPITECPRFVKVGQNCISCFLTESKVDLKCRMSDEKTCRTLFLESGLGRNGPKVIEFNVSDGVHSGGKEGTKFPNALVLALVLFIANWFLF